MNAAKEVSYAPRGSGDVTGYTYHASVYCPEHGEELPETDPEGNERHAIFPWDEFNYLTYCGKNECDLAIESNYILCDLMEGHPHYEGKCDASEGCLWSEGGGE